MRNEPDFDDVVADVEADEVERLRQVHRLLVAAGPPPELPPYLAEPPAERRRRTGGFFPRRRLEAAVVLAAAVLAAAFGGGYLVGHWSADDGFAVSYSVPMEGLGDAAAARASIQVGYRDEGGNYPLLVRVRGLERLPEGGYYELWLSKDGRLVLPCGSFRVHGGTTLVSMSVPYPLRKWRKKRFDGWVVVARPAGKPRSTEPLLTT